MYAPAFCDTIGPRGSCMDTGRMILLWYQKNKRDLPWRHTHDPYAVLVSEMMLQQTTVDTVLRYYDAFMARFPDAAVLAAADESDVLHAWQGLGYYRRARNLHRAAKMIAQDGAFPDTYDAVRALPGVGPYIAGAVMSIAYDAPYPAVDGNVQRVIARIFGLHGDVTRPAVRRDIEARVKAMMPPGHAGDFTQALMELGALVCRPKAPDCPACPVRDACAARRDGNAEMLPVKAEKRRPVVVPLWAVVVVSPGAVLMEYRGESGLLARMWGVPLLERTGDTPPDVHVCDLLGIDAGRGRVIGRVTHVFTHRRWDMDVVVYTLDDAPDTPLSWAAWDKLGELAIPTAFKKVLDVVQKHR